MSEPHGFPRHRGMYDVIVIGGGLYGCCVALFAREHQTRVALMERGTDLLQRASYKNQARVHKGYHYPRSILTGMRACLNMPRFCLDFKDCVDTTFRNAYAIAAQNTKTNAYQFVRFCQTIGAPVWTATDSLKSLFNSRLIEDVFLVEEYALNTTLLREVLRRRIEAAGVDVLYQTDIARVAELPNGRLAVYPAGQDEALTSTVVFNCTYSGINRVLHNSGLPLLPLKHEITELALLEMPEELSDLGVTVMDGPFFSAMPFPAQGLHSLSHVRYTPHESWEDLGVYRDGALSLETLASESRYPYMIRDAQRYLPLIGRARYVESLFEIKTILTQNEVDDGRPILFRENYGFRNFSIVMGSKIDNIYDALDALRQMRSNSKLAIG